MTQHRERPQVSGSVSEIVEDIERTRAQLGDTVDALAAKLDVKSQVKNTASQAKANMVESAGHAAGSAQQRWREIAVVLATAAAVVLIWRRMS